MPAAQAPSSSSLLWKRIAPLRGLAMCLVVANHASQSSTAAFATAHERLSPYENPIAFVTVSLVRAFTPACLVAFMFASGFMAFRFMRTRAQALPAAGLMLRKYLVWSCVVLAFEALRHRSIDWADIVRDLASGRAMPAYWFLMVLIPLYASAPLWARLCSRSPELALGMAVLLQVGSCARFYAFDIEAAGSLPLWDAMLVRPLRFLPPFLIGMLVSRDANMVSSWLAKHRRGVLIGLATLAAGCLAETFLLDRATRFSWRQMDQVFATERLSLIVFALLGIVYALNSQPRWPRLQTWLASIGSASLGIMLLTDFFILAGTRVWWRLARLLYDDGSMTLANHRLPAFFADASLWLTPLLFWIGLWGPLTVMALARKHFGPRTRHLW